MWLQFKKPPLKIALVQSMTADIQYVMFANQTANLYAMPASKPEYQQTYLDSLSNIIN